MCCARAPGASMRCPRGTRRGGRPDRASAARTLSLSNEPIIVVDGIRVENGATGQTATSIGVGGQTPSRLDDLSPEDVESIEIVKGPSAAALYGTDAANGVIQIRTKRGRPRPTKWTAFAEGGPLNDITAWPANYTSVTNTGAYCTLI